MPKQLRTLSIYRKIIERLAEFRLVSPPLMEQLAGKVGFDGIPSEGDSILPVANGPATGFNAHGKEIIRRDLPIETRSRMIHTSWQDWHGQTHYGIQTRNYEAYPRELIPPPEEFVTAMRKDGHVVAASRIIECDETEADIVHLLNVFLECFPSFEIVQPDLTKPTKVRKLAWKILPQGQYPFERARQALEDYLQKLSEDNRATATERIRAITRHSPDFIAVGLGGFSDYVVFGFIGRRRYVLESPNTGNATYIFRNDWETVSRLSKREILQENIEEARLIHNSRWYKAVSEVINRQ
nr:hypothetical protein [Desulfobacula sp.]